MSGFGCRIDGFEIRGRFRSHCSGYLRSASRLRTHRAHVCARANTAGRNCEGNHGSPARAPVSFGKSLRNQARAPSGSRDDLPGRPQRSFHLPSSAASGLPYPRRRKKPAGADRCDTRELSSMCRLPRPPVQARLRRSTHAIGVRDVPIVCACGGADARAGSYRRESDRKCPQPGGRSRSEPL
jgi:hypothetical protein